MPPLPNWGQSPRASFGCMAVRSYACGVWGLTPNRHSGSDPDSGPGVRPQTSHRGRSCAADRRPGYHRARERRRCRVRRPARMTNAIVVRRTAGAGDMPPPPRSGRAPDATGPGMRIRTTTGRVNPAAFRITRRVWRAWWSISMSSSDRGFGGGRVEGTRTAVDRLVVRAGYRRAATSARPFSRPAPACFRGTVRATTSQSCFRRATCN